jgi:hypothetical protein
MKKILPLAIFLVIFLTLAKEANATTTLFMGGTFGGAETITDNTIPNTYSGGISSSVINITYIKTIEVVFEWQNGATNYNWLLPMEYGNFKIGYPIVDEKSGLIFITAGYQNVKRDQLTEAKGVMLGMDVIAVAADNFYAGLDVQYSLFGATYRRIYPFLLELPMDQFTLKLKAQYIMTDHLGLVVNFQWLHFDANNGLIKDDILIPSAGLIFRF